VDEIQNSFIVNRRNRLISFAGSQSNVQNISIGTIEFAPTSGNQGEEYIALTNNNQSFATDLSGWTLSGAIDHTLKSGTVIPAGETLYVLADVQGFQARTTGPRGGQQLLTQGNYEGRLNNSGGTLVLMNASGTQIDTETYVGVANNGDFDSDGDIDGLDFLAWQIGYGITSGADPSQGDANSDGAVDQIDLGLWEANYSSPLGALAGIADQPAAEGTAPAELTSVVGWLAVEPEDNSTALDAASAAHAVAFSSLAEEPILAPALYADQDALGTQVSQDSKDSEAEETPASLEELFDSVFEQSSV
jgi:hypothetical protein